MSAGLSAGAIAGIAAGAASLGGAIISSNAATGAANTQAQSASNASQAELQAANNAIAAQQQGQEAGQANQQPWINAGSSALSQLGSLLGIQISPSSQFSAQASSAGGGAAGGTGGPSLGGPGGGLVQMQNGIPSPNQQLYQTNPAYRNAWDKIYASNIATFGGTGYTAQSNPAVINSLIQNELGPQQLAAINQTFQPGTMYGGPTGGFAGSNGNSASALQTLQNTPGYQFTLDQGMKAIENSAAARGMQLSGANLQDLSKFAEGTAQQTYQQDVGNLMQLAGYGGNAASGAAGNAVATGGNIGSTITGVGNNIGSNIIGAGNAAAAGQVGSANALGSGLGSLGQIYTLNNLFGTGGGGGGGASGGYNFSSGLPQDPSYGVTYGA